MEGLLAPLPVSVLVALVTVLVAAMPRVLLLVAVMMVVRAWRAAPLRRQADVNAMMDRLVGLARVLLGHCGEGTDRRRNSRQPWTW